MALSGIQRTFAGVLNSIWGKNAQTTIPTQPVSGIAYRDTDAEFESGQKYDSLGESSRWNQLLYLLTGLTSELANFGILPWSSAQSYTKGALSIAPNGGLYQAQVNIAANAASPVQPGTNNAVWAVPDIPGYVLTSRKIIAGTGLSGGGSLEADRTFTIKYGTAAGTACQGNDARVTASEAFRLSMIGVPRYWRSTPLPAGHVWANGDLALFADWPELKKMLSDGGVYDYSIYWDRDTNILFACQKTRGEESSQDMGANPIVQKWWDYMADIMEVNPDNSPVTIPLPEVFHME